MSPEPKMPTAKELAQKQKSQILTNAELIKGGADYQVEENGNLRLEATKDQIEAARAEMQQAFEDIENKKVSEEEYKYFKGELKIFEMSMEIVYQLNSGKIDAETYKNLLSRTNDLHNDGRNQFRDKIGDESLRKMERIIRERFHQQIEKAFADAKDFEIIIDTINKVAGIKGSQQYYDNKTLKTILNQVYNGHLDINYVTNAYGLRDAMERIMEAKNASMESRPENSNGNESAQEQELKPETVRDLEDFKEFALSNKSEIAKIADKNVLEDFIYDNFYSNGRTKLYEAGTQETQSLRLNYNKEIVKLREDIGREFDMDSYLKRGENPPVSIARLGYWTSCSMGEDVKIEKNIGRIYLNLKPQESVQFFKDAVKFFAHMKLDLQMKIPSEFEEEKSEQVLNRQDKMVIYFNEGSEEKVLDVLGYLYDKYKNSFNEGLPRFSASLKDSAGSIMKGIGFAEEPQFVRRRNESFGSIRSAILSEVLKKITNAGKSLKGVDLGEYFKEVCQKYKVDPANPAFNIGSSRLNRESAMYHRL